MNSPSSNSLSTQPTSSEDSSGSQRSPIGWKWFRKWFERKNPTASVVKKHKLDAIILEDRILYSASPFLALGDYGGQPDPQVIDQLDEILAAAWADPVPVVEASTVEPVSSEPATSFKKLCELTNNVPSVSNVSPLDVSNAASQPTTVLGESNAFEQSIGPCGAGVGPEIFAIDHQLDDLDRLLEDLQSNREYNTKQENVSLDHYTTIRDGGSSLLQVDQQWVGTNVVLIDSSLADSTLLAKAAYPGSQIFFYDSLSDSAHGVLSRVIEWAAHNDARIHTLSILSHGAEGGFELGNEWVTDASLTKNTSDWQNLSQYMLDDANIAIFGCNVDANGSGKSLLDDLSKLTGTDVFASINVTGKGGDWILESSSLQRDNIVAAGLVTPFNIELLEASDASLAWYNASWAYRKQIAIDYTKVSGGSSLTDFPILIQLSSDASLAANAQADGDDILFTLADGTTKLSHEIETFTSASGALMAWVKIPSLSASANTTIYVYYGNSGASNQQSAAAVWSNGYAGVWHLNGNANDSTSNANNGTATGTTTTAGLFGNALDFNGTSDLITINNAASLQLTSALTLEGWARPDTFGTGSDVDAILRKGDTNPNNYQLAIQDSTGYFTLDGSDNGTNGPNTATLSAATWYNVVGTFDGTNSSIYLNGSLSASEADTAPTTDTRALYIGGRVGPADLFDGKLDEVRISSVARSTGWIATQYNNQNSPSTFFTLSTAQGPAASLTGSYVQTFDSMGTSGTAAPVGFSALTMAGTTSTFTSSTPISAAGIAGATAGSTTLVVQNTPSTPWSSSNQLANAASIADGNDRALGSGPTGTAGTVIQLAIDNNTGGSLSSIMLGYDMKVLNMGSSGSGEVGELPGYSFFYSTTGGTSASDWTLVSALSISDTVSGNVDHVEATITFSTAVANGSTIFLRWADDNNSANSPDQNFAIDNVVINRAPVLADTSLSIIVAEDAGVPTGVVGSLISAFIGGVSDADSGAVKGIAITASVETNGTWYYTTNNGTNWMAVGSVSSASSLLLADDANTRLYFAPGSNYNGTSTSALTIRAWDQTSGTAGTKVSTSSNGGVFAFSSATDVVDVSVTAVNDAPVSAVDTATAVEAGGTANGTAGTNPTGNVLTNDTDVDTGDTKTVSGVAAGIVGSASGSVASNVTGTYGSITIAANGTYTYTVDNSNSTVQALRTAGNTITDVFTYTMQDAGGLSSTTQITITIQGANDAPYDLATTGLTVAENAANTTNVGTITRSDLDSSDNPTYSLVDSAGGRFAINASTGVVTVASSSLLNYELATSHSITVRVTDLAGAVYDEVFTVTLTDVNEFAVSTPTDSNATANAVNENVAIGTVVGITASSSDSDATTNTVTYSLFNNDGGNFTIDANTGIVTTAAALNRESLGASRNITIRATSVDGSTADTVFTININDLDEFDTSAVTDSNAAANSVAENAANGTVVGITALASDADATTNAITYSLDNNAGGRFTIDANTGVVTVADGTLLNYEAATSHNITIRATSADTSFSTQSFTINLTDVNEAAVGSVSDSNAAANYVLENASNGTVVGVTGLASDPDGTDTVTYSLDNNAGGRFTIDTNTGVVTVNGAIDREAAASYNITIRATSSDTSFSTQAFTINIGDVDEFDTGAVSDSNAAANSVVENAANGTVVGITGLASDADATTNTITYSLQSNDGGRFAIDANTGIVTVAGAINREVDGASRNITIRATSADGSFTDQVFSIAIVDADEFDVTAPTDSNAAANAVNENVSIGTLVGITATSSDADATTNAVTYSLFNSDGGNFAIDANTGVVTTAAALNRETLGASRNITIRATSADGSTADTVFTININDLDEFDTSAVTDSNAAANSVAENAANGTVVGITALASDADATTNAITYSLDSSAGGRFAIDANTGVVTVADGTLLNYETATSHAITIRATSADGSSSTQVFTINLTDVNESAITAISDTDASSNFAIENASIGTVVGVTAFASDADGTDVVTYSLDDNAGGRFAIDANTGVVTVSGAIDREAAASYNITIRATSTDSSTSTATSTITIGDVDEFDTGAVTDTNAAANSVVENAANGTVVGITGLASDADATTNTITYSLQSNDGGRFAIDANTGIVTVAGAINREVDGASRNITVRATSADGSFTDQIFSIAIVDADEFDVTAPTDSNAATNAVNENVSIGTLVGITALSSDADATTNVVTYSLFDNDGGNFSIDANTGVVTTAAALNRETLGASRNITVRATSADGSTADTVFTININDLDEFDTSAVTDSNVTANSVAENAANGTVVGITGLASDADATTNAITYSLDNNAGGRFTIDANTGVVTVADGTLLNYEAATSHNITIRATSADTSFSTQSFTINLTDVNEAAVGSVSDSNAAANYVLENASNGTVVGVTGLASDPDGTDTVTYSLDNNAGGRFTIDTNTGIVTVNGAIDREAAASYNITIRATSSDTSFSTQAFTINIGDVDEFDTGAVSDSNAAANSVVENAANGTVVGITGLASDADATTNTITYSLQSNDGGRFAIDANTGIVTVAGAINREVDGASRNITIRATSADGSFTDQVFSIAIVDADEFDVTAPTDSNAAANAVNENVSIGTLVGITATSSDADATTNAVTYSLFNSDGGNFAIDANTGVVTTAAALNRETLGASRNITIRATSADGSTADTVFTININDLDEFDTSAVTDSNAAANSVAENAANGTVVGITALASDADATTNAITYSLDSSAGGRFAIDANTGVVTVADGTLLNYETATSHAITIRATSADGSSSTQVFTINLTDVNESAITAISDTDASSNFAIENASIGTVVGVTAFASDADGTDVVTYSLDDNAGGRFAIDANTGVVTVSGAIDREAAASYNITIRATSTDSSTSTATSTITIGDVDEFDTGAVTDTNAAANSVVENAANGTVVGITGLASDADATTNTITYSLQSNDGGRFAIDANTGIVTVAGAINREVDGASRNITVRATSADGSFTDQIFSIAIVDADEFDVTAPTDSNAATNAVNENVSIGTLVGITALSSDADATTNLVTYSLFDNDGGNFSIDANTGVVTTAAALNRETLGASRNITIRATSADGSTADTVFTININDLDEFDTSAVTDSNAAANSVAENAANGTVVGITALASDADATTNAITYSLDSSAGGRFAIDANTGVVTVADGTLLNYETATSHAITIRATSADGSSSTQVFTINLTDVNESAITAISDTDASSNFAIENASIGTVVGVTAFASDADGTDVVTYSLDDNAGGRFAIDANTGVVTVSGAIDREAAASYNITIRATSTDSSTSTTTSTITIGDVDEFDVVVPTDVDATLNAVNENAAIGTVVGITASAFDSDATNNGVTYTLFNSDGGRFAIDSITGVVTVAGSLNRETLGSSRNITVCATSADGSIADTIFSVNINDLDEFDTGVVADSNGVANSVAENAANGTVVGVTAFASDADATTNAITYSLDTSAGGRFSIDALTGIVTVADGTLLDYETAVSHSITVRATSADGSSSTQSFTISLVDVNEDGIGAVSDSNNAANAVLENVAIGTTVGITGFATDPDGTDTVAYSLDDNAGGRFAIDAVTGVVTVAGSIDREAASSFNITIRAISTDLSMSTRTMTIMIGDVDEFDVSSIIDIDLASNNVAENAANGTVVGVVVMASDADATLSGVVYSLDDDANGRFTIDATTGVVTVADGSALNYEAASSHGIVVRATSTDGSSTTLAVSIGIADVNETPIGTADSYGTTFIDNLVVSVPGLLANDLDPDGNSLSVVLVSGPSLGVLTLQSDGSFSYDPEANFVGLVNFTYRVTDGLLISSDIVVTIVVAIPNNLPGGGSGNGGSGSGDPPPDNDPPPSDNPPPVVVGPDASTNTTTTAVETIVRTEVLVLPSIGPELAENEEPRWSSDDVSNGLDLDRADRGYESITQGTTTHLYREESGRRYRLGDEDRNRSSEFVSERIEFEDESEYFGVGAGVVQTVLGTGLVIWMMQGAQLLATIIAATPAWIQLDPIAVLPKASEDDVIPEDELTEGEKLFEDIKK